MAALYCSRSRARKGATMQGRRRALVSVRGLGDADVRLAKNDAHTHTPTDRNKADG